MTDRRSAGEPAPAGRRRGEGRRRRELGGSAFLIALTCLASTAARSAASAESPRRPNIVLMMADDMGWADVPWHEPNAGYHLPHLERLAREGLRLEAHYVHPMCSPTRAALMTGRFASRFGVTGAQNERALPFGTVTIASALRSAGYETAITGKWHLGSDPDWGPQRYGFDHGYGSLAGGCGPYDHRYKQGPFTETWHRNGQRVKEEGHVTDLIAREAVGWLEGRGAKPFFLYVPFTAIHVPIDEPETLQQRNAHLSDPGHRLRGACATHLDDAVGLVLAALERRGLLANTLVLFLSDNGAHAPGDNQGGPYPGEYARLKVGNTNAPLRGHKSQVYDGGIRTPAVAYWPGQLATGEIREPLHAVDWMPTLCGLAGATPAGDLKWDGQDVWPLLSGQQRELPARTIYSAAPGFRAQMVRHGDWKLVVTGTAGKRGEQAGAEELFHLADDPGEAKNLAAEQPERLAQLKQRLAEISARDRDAVVED